VHKGKGFSPEEKQNGPAPKHNKEGGRRGDVRCLGARRSGDEPKGVPKCNGEVIPNVF